ncbi:MAG TPA: hypothetical protein VK540_08950 [Polyangiaceae bacterium]|nr:hypothetical protein [Polyangiaceae bacterium]
MKRIIGLLCSSTFAIACGAAPSDTGPQPSGDRAAVAEPGVNTAANEGANLSSQQAAAGPHGSEAVDSEEAIRRKVSAGDMAAARQVIEQYERRGVSSRATAAARQLIEQYEQGGVSRQTSKPSAPTAPGQGELRSAPITDPRSDCLEDCAEDYAFCLAGAVLCLPLASICGAICIAQLNVCRGRCPPADPGDPPPPPPPPDCQVCCDFDGEGNCTHCVAPPQVCP